MVDSVENVETLNTEMVNEMVDNGVFVGGNDDVHVGKNEVVGDDVDDGVEDVGTVEKMFRKKIKELQKENKLLR